MRIRYVLAVIAAAGVMVSACGEISTGGPGPVDGTTPAGTSWVARTITDDSGTTEVPPGSAPTVDFGGDGRTVSGSTGCNLYSGEVTIGGRTIAVGQLAVTERACLDSGVMDLEARFLAVLSGADSFSLSDDALELRAGAAAVSFVPATPVPDAALDGTAWVLETLLDGDTATSVVMGTSPTLTIDVAGGSMRGSTGCNDFGGEVRVDGAALVVSGMNWTEIGCEPAVMTQEAFVLDVLQQAQRYAIDGDRLTIDGAAGRALVYRAG